MPRLSKTQMIAELANLGVIAPKGWTVTELEYHLHERRQELGIETGKGKKTPLQEYVTKMNVAARKKADLQEFLQSELGVTPNPNSTISQMTKDGLQKIYLMTPGHPIDPVGFGQHSSLTYLEVKQNHAEYCKWVQKTSKEGECSLMLKRLAQWLDNPGMDMPTAVTPPVTKSSTSSQPDSEGSQAMQMMASMATAIHQLKEEVASLKEERPRKTAAMSMEAESVGSFEMMSPAPWLLRVSWMPL